MAALHAAVPWAPGNILHDISGASGAGRILRPDKTIQPLCQRFV